MFVQFGMRRKVIVLNSDRMWQDTKSISDVMARKTPCFRAPAWFLLLFLCAATFAMPGFGHAPITNGLLAHWSGDGNAKDSANHFDGKVSGGLSYVPGPTGQAFQFNGGDAQVDFGPNIGNFGTRDFTIAYWMKTSDPYHLTAFLDKRPICNAGNWWDIRVGTGGPPTPGLLAFEMDDGTQDGYVRFVTTRPLNDGVWHHVAWERQSTSSGSITYLVYVDGMLNSTTNHPYATEVQNTAPLVMGQNTCQCCDGTRPYRGTAAELQMFSHALSPEEILSLYKAGQPGK